MRTVVYACLLMVATAGVSLAQRQQAPPVLAVTGNAQIFAVPDEATVRLGIVRQTNSAQAAQEQANTVAQEILTAITKTGVPPQQIQTARLVLSPIYAPRSPESREAPRIVAYNASNSVSVRLSDLSLIGPVIDAGLKAGANQLEGVQFGLRNDLPAREEALKQAVAEARSKAQTMADAMNLKLDEVIEISEGGVSVMTRGEIPLNGRAEFALAQTPISAGQLEVHANVSVRYRISPK
jgi:uncharacterized protein